MQFCFFGRPKPEVLSDPPADLMDKVRGDWEKSRAYHAEGVFRQLWMAGEGVIFICEADSCEQMEALLAELPMAKANLIDIELYELTRYRGFSPQPQTA